MPSIHQSIIPSCRHSSSIIPHFIHSQFIIFNLFPHPPFSTTITSLKIAHPQPSPSTIPSPISSTTLIYHPDSQSQLRSQSLKTAHPKPSNPAILDPQFQQRLLPNIFQKPQLFRRSRPRNAEDRTPRIIHCMIAWEDSLQAGECGAWRVLIKGGRVWRVQSVYLMMNDE